MADVFSLKGVEQSQDEQINATYSHVKELLKVAKASGEVATIDGRKVEAGPQSLRDFLRSVGGSRRTIADGHGHDVSERVRDAYLSLASRHLVTERKERKGTLTVEDKRDFLRALEHTLSVEPTREVARSLGNAEEALKLSTMPQRKEEPNDARGSGRLAGIVGAAMGVIKSRNADDAAHQAVDQADRTAARNRMRQTVDAIGSAQRATLGSQETPSAPAGLPRTPSQNQH